MDDINDAVDLCGYVFTFGSIDLYSDVVEKGAYKK